MKPREDAIHLAAQCWCDEETSHKEMDSTLAMAFAKRLEVIIAERDSLKEQLEIAVDAIYKLHGEWQKQKGWKSTWAYKITSEAIEQIKVNNLSQIVDRKESE